MTEERQELINQRGEVEGQIESLYKEQRELRDKIQKIIHEELPALERKSGDLLRDGGDYEEVNDLIGKKKRQTRSMDVAIGEKEKELSELRRKVEALNGELDKLPAEPEPVETINNKERRT